MATVYTWTSTELTTLTNATYTTAVIGSYYTVTGVDGDYTGSLSGYQAIPLSVSGETPYDSLTNELVTEWIKTEMGEAQVLIVENNVNNQILIQQGQEPVIIEPTPGRVVVDTGIDNNTTNITPSWD